MSGKAGTRIPTACREPRSIYAYRATQLDPTNAEALAIYGHLLPFLHKDIGMALHYFDRAFQLNRNLPFIWVFSALSYCYIGNPETALRRLRPLPRIDGVIAVLLAASRIRSRSPT